MSFLSDFYGYRHDLKEAQRCIKKIIIDTDKFYLNKEQRDAFNDALRVLDELFEKNDTNTARVSQECYNRYKRKRNHEL